MKKIFMALCFLCIPYWTYAAPVQLVCGQSPYLLADEVGSPSCNSNPALCHWIMQCAYYSEIDGYVHYLPQDPVNSGGSDTEASCTLHTRDMQAEGVQYEVLASVHQHLRYPCARIICYAQAQSVATYMQRHAEGWIGPSHDVCP